MKVLQLIILLIFFTGGALISTVYAEGETVPFVMQLTRSADNYGHRKAFLQIDKVLNDIGEKKLQIVVVAYEDGIHALLEENKKNISACNQIS